MASQGRVLGSDVGGTCRAGVVGVIGGTFAICAMVSPCPGISVKSLTIDCNSLIWHLWRCRSCRLSAAVGGVLSLVGSGVSWVSCLQKNNFVLYLSGSPAHSQIHCRKQSSVARWNAAVTARGMPALRWYFSNSYSSTAAVCTTPSLERASKQINGKSGNLAQK